MSAISTGRVVQYRVTEDQANRTNARRADAKSGVITSYSGAVAHFGNHVFADGRVNLQVFLDGNDTLWATSVTQGNDNGQWFWPERV